MKSDTSLYFLFLLSVKLVIAVSFNLFWIAKQILLDTLWVSCSNLLSFFPAWQRQRLQKQKLIRANWLTITDDDKEEGNERPSSCKRELVERNKPWNLATDFLPTHSFPMRSNFYLNITPQLTVKNTNLSFIHVLSLSIN